MSTDTVVTARSEQRLIPVAAEYAATGLALAAASAGGAILLAVAENGTSSLRSLTVHIAFPAAAALVIILAVSTAVRWRRLARCLVVGFAAGAFATGPLELARNIGFYQFHSMPGQIPELMGVLLTNRIMLGPDTASNIIGWADHVWNGAMFGVVYALLAAGVPGRARRWAGPALGSLYGALLGTGFLLSPVSRATGAGIFGSVLGAKYVITVYIAHLAFGATLGWLVQRFSSPVEPIWAAAVGQVRRAGRKPG